MIDVASCYKALKRNEAIEIIKTVQAKAVFNHGLASSFLEDSFLTKIMEYWTTLNNENNLDFTSCQIWYNSL